MHNTTIYSEEHSIRPAARHILSIGRGLIKDVYTALVEIIKNAYDADATKVDIYFEKTQDNFKITVSDDGHGMDLNTILTAWLVPSTTNKVKRTHSPKGRLLQGKKGIGRYAASILGDDLMMITREANNNTETIIVVDWKLFESAEVEYLDEVKLLVETKQYSENINGGTSLYFNNAKEWGEEQYEDLKREVSNLISPISVKDKNDFNIGIHFIGFIYKNLNYLPIEHSLVFELCPHHLTAKTKIIEENNQKKLIASIEYQNHYKIDDKSLKMEKDVEIELDKSFDLEVDYCGDLEVDFRIFDLDTRDLEFFLAQNNQLYLLDRKELEIQIKRASGVGLYRGGFRIRPYGDNNFDWLKLDLRRVNNPTHRVSTNQIIGYVSVQDEITSQLEEKISREGLQEKKPYKMLQSICLTLLKSLEEYRSVVRNQLKEILEKNRVIIPIQDIKSVAKLDELRDDVKLTLETANVDVKVIRKIVDSIQQAEKEKEKKVDQIVKVIKDDKDDLNNLVSLYQVQATLGKIMTMKFHELKRPLAYILMQEPNLIRWINEILILLKDVLFLNEIILTKLEKLKDRIEKIGSFAKDCDILFSALQPFAHTKRPIKQKFSLLKAIHKAKALFESDFKLCGIEWEENIFNNEISLKGWEIDIMTAFANLIENSIFWIIQKGANTNKKISVTIVKEGNSILIDYYDTGLGIDKDLIEQKQIFVHGFTKKTDGTGIGMSIANEAIKRNMGKIQAVYNDSGAHFQIIFQIN